MRTLVTLADLRTWSREEIEDGDPFAESVALGASYKVAEAAHHLEWLDEAYADPIPYRAQLIMWLLAARSFKNPDSIISEGGIGPIGGDRYVEEFAKFLTLTDAEIAELEELWPATDSTGGGLYTITTQVRPGPASDDTVWVQNTPYVGSDAFPMGSTADAAAYGV